MIFKMLARRIVRPSACAWCRAKDQELQAREGGAGGAREWICLDCTDLLGLVEA